MTSYTPPPSQSDLRNLIVAVVLCTGLLFVWQILYQNPKEAARQAAMQSVMKPEEKNKAGDVVLPHSSEMDATTIAEERAGLEGGASALPREEIIEQDQRVKISSPSIHGSVNLKGLRFDDLTLVRHKISMEKDSPDVVLLSPAQYAERYFIQIGWLGAGAKGKVTVPDADSVWQADHAELKPQQPVTFRWMSPENVEFSVTATLDENYMITVSQKVKNNSGDTVTVMPYGLINLAQPSDNSFSAILHHGPIGVLDGTTLTEVPYKELSEDGVKRYEGAKGWFGIADKYWLTAIIPEKNERFTANFQPLFQNNQHRAQVDYLAKAQKVAPGQEEKYNLHVFAGAKELDLLEKYRSEQGIPLFDRALDFGALYFLTKPIFLTLDYFYGLLGNFGLAILLFVVLLKLFLFPLSNKSYTSMAKMKALQPELDALRKKYDHDKIKMQQEVMALWQREKVNPISGCFPVLIQLPIFFSLYKMLLVTIEMRHAPFYGWIQDLSAKDPTNIFTLFGLIPWNPPTMFHLGAWPIIMCGTMILQQRLNPKPADPIQAKVIGFMPFIFLVLFGSFPAGLLIYWAWNNALSILQQWWITRNFERKQAKKKSPKAAE